MECKVCGVTLNRMTSTHLRGPKCKALSRTNSAHHNKRLTVSQYQEEFGAGSANLDGPKKITPKRKSVLKMLDGLDRSVIAAEVLVIDDEIAVLVAKKRKLQAIADVLPDAPKATTSNQPTHTAPIPNSPIHQESVGIKVFTYLDAAGSAGIGAIARGIGISSKEARPLLNQLVDDGKIKLKNGSYSL